MHTSIPPCDTPRERYLRVRLADHEHECLRAHAVAENRSVSELVRLALPLDAAPTPRTNPLSNVEPVGVVVTRRGESA